MLGHSNPSSILYLGQRGFINITGEKKLTEFNCRLCKECKPTVPHYQRGTRSSKQSGECIHIDLVVPLGVRHGEFIRNFLQELGFKSDKVHWYCDNTATVTAATSPGHIGRTRYLDVKLKRTSELTQQGNISIEYIPTLEQEADGLTKRLVNMPHKRFCGLQFST